ncbi:unnamed protein product [Porites evermanni]|uniref:Uncharacterized protein n=1 Tax=Porites evermanni TaxID=104178 RepID=A0ABN8PDE9_9CNID|nr:unnamed protein product [Porites evermanni]
MSILQNGKIPRFWGEEVVQETFSRAAASPCIGYLREGLSKLGIYQPGSRTRIFIHLLRQNPARIISP